MRRRHARGHRLRVGRLDLVADLELAQLRLNLRIVDLDRGRLTRVVLDRQLVLRRRRSPRCRRQLLRDPTARQRARRAPQDRRLLLAERRLARYGVEVLRVPATRSDEELAIELLEQDGVYLHPGHFYGFPTEGYLVVSLIASMKSFAEGLTRTLARL